MMLLKYRVIVFRKVETAVWVINLSPAERTLFMIFGEFNAAFNAI